MHNNGQATSNQALETRFARRLSQIRALNNRARMEMHSSETSGKPKPLVRQFITDKKLCRRKFQQKSQKNNDKF